MRRTLALLVLSSVLVVGIATAASPVGRGRLPEAIPLTSAATAGTGFRAEGIESSGRFAYAGSLATGTIVRVDLLTEAVTTLVESAGGPAVGLELHRGVLLVAGGVSGQLRAYDQVTGDELAEVQLAPPDTAFINDVTVTGHAAYATDSRSATLYRVPIGRDGSLGAPEPLTLTGDFELVAGFNANGIVGTFSGRLVLAQSTDPLDGTGSALYAVTVDAATRARPSPSGSSSTATSATPTASCSGVAPSSSSRTNSTESPRSGCRPISHAAPSSAASPTRMPPRRPPPPSRSAPCTP